MAQSSWTTFFEVKSAIPVSHKNSINGYSNYIVKYGTRYIFAGPVGFEKNI